jgi:hypothetical protein
MSGTMTITSRGAAWVGVEGGEQLVVEHLDLALGAVGDVEADRVVAGATGGQVSRVWPRGAGRGCRPAAG